MAEIVKALDTSTSGPAAGRVVAVKRILPHLCEDEQYKTMFLDESRVLAQLEHEDIIKTYEIGEIDGTPYIALEFIDGQDARMLFHRTRRNEERVPIPEACYIIAKVCEGLHHAHEQTDAGGELLGLVHRDVSLQNVLLSYDGDVKITDFGIAMSTENVARTEVGIVKGKFGYMSPEQIKGAPLDRRSDVFATGICLYELLTGERLFSGDSDYKAVERVRNVDVASPSSINRLIPSGLERIVMKALAKHPRDRYQSANDMRRALLAFLAENGEPAGRSELSEYLRRVFADDIAGVARPDATPIPRPSLAPAALPVVSKATTKAIDARQAPRADSRTDSRPDAAPAPPAKLQPADQTPARAQMPLPADPLTGLAAFDNLEQPSALNMMPDPPEPPPAPVSVVQPGVPRASLPPAVGPRAHVVPPIVPNADSIPGLPASAFLAQQSAAPLDMDWDEDEPSTQSRGFDEIEPVPDAGAGDDDDVTRQVRLDETFPGLRSAETGEFPPTLDPPSRVPLDPSGRAPVVRHIVAVDDTARPPPGRSGDLRPYMPVVAVVIGIVVVIVVGLQAFGSRAGATIRFSTEPLDAVVTVDGARVAGRASPFVLSDLAPDVDHTINVAKPGFTQWSTRLRVRGGKVLDLPPITLERQPGAEPEPPPTAAAPAQEAGAPEPPVPAPAAPPVHSRPAAHEPAPAPTRVKGKPPVSQAPAPAHSGAPSHASAGQVNGPKGTLRLNTRPWSKVTVDGKAVGNTPLMNLVLAAGSHKIKLVNSEFGLSKTITIDIPAGQTVTKVLTLQ